MRTFPASALKPFFLALIGGGVLAMSRSFTDPTSLKMPLMTAGMAGLFLLHLGRLRLTAVLVPFLLFWLCAYFNLSGTGLFQEAAVALVATLLAFLLGYLRAPLTHAGLIPALILLCVGRGVYDIVTLSDEASFFGDKHVFGSILILGAFYHFYLMERGDPHKPVQVFLYTSSLVVLLSILLVDSRIAQGAFFLCFLPLLFVSVRLDGKEPRLERLAWITGITLCLGLAWINLPERQLHQIAMALSPSSPGFLRWAWTSAWNTFRTSPWMGSGTGGFRFAVIGHQETWSFKTEDGALPMLGHAHNHYLETLAEGGLLTMGMEAILLAVAFFGLARVYFRETRLEAKYAFFCLAALCLMGLFSPLLESAPTRIAYWALVGYGWSFLAEGRPSRGYAKVLLGAAMLLPAVLHLCQRIPEFRSDRLYARARSESNPKVYTDLLAESLRMNPRNESANYSYAEILAGFHRESEAIKRLEFIQGFAPDSDRQGAFLAKVYFSLGRYDSAARYASRELRHQPLHLPTLEILLKSWALQANCHSVDSLKNSLASTLESYAMPPSREYTIGGLDSLFRSNTEVLFLQRWFAGKALKKAFVENRLNSYNRHLENRQLLLKLMEFPCIDPGSNPPTAPKPPGNWLWKSNSFGLRIPLGNQGGPMG